MYTFKIACRPTQKRCFLNTGYDVSLHDKLPTAITSEQLILYYILSYIILLYNFITLIWLMGLVEVGSTCFRQPMLITC